MTQHDINNQTFKLIMDRFDAIEQTQRDSANKSEDAHKELAKQIKLLTESVEEIAKKMLYERGKIAGIALAISAFGYFVWEFVKNKLFTHL